jgi:hypothetical protein
LPDFAAPKSGDVENSSEGPADAIRYRKLARADFKRTSPPGKIQHGKYELGALTCGTLLTSPDTQIQLETITEASGKKRYRGRFKILKFRALMDRQCSWWNPKNREPAYTLLHEQIEQSLERNGEFDQETSLGHDPERQEQWWQDVQRELAETRAFQ